MRGLVKFTLGGIERETRVTLGLAPDIEEATNKGLLTIADEVWKFTARLTDIAQIIRLALAQTGVKYSRAEVIDLIAFEGVAYHVETAARLLSALLEKPEGAKDGKKGKAPKANGAAITSL